MCHTVTYDLSESYETSAEYIANLPTVPDFAGWSCILASCLASFDLCPAILATIS